MSNDGGQKKKTDEKKSIKFGIAALILIIIGVVFVVSKIMNFMDPDYVTIPDRGENYYYDSAGVLSESTKSYINSENRRLEEKDGTQIVVAVVDKIKGFSDIDEYRNKFFEKWKIGSAEKDNGVLIVAAIEDRKVGIEVGYGLEDKLTDAKAGRIIDQDIRPNFEQEKYDKGLKEAFESVENVVEDKNEEPEKVERQFEREFELDGWTIKIEDTRNAINEYENISRISNNSSVSAGLMAFAGIIIILIIGGINLLRKKRAEKKATEG